MGARGGGGGGGESVRARTKERYFFPILKNADIIECLAELNIYISLADLERARPATVQHVYEQLLIGCLDVTKEELAQPKFFGLEALRHADLHDESVPVLHFYRAMDKLLRAAGVPQGFGLMELCKPDKRSIRRNLSAIINFHKFRDDRLAVYQEHSEAHRVLEEERAAAEAEGEELQRQLDALVAKREAARPEEEALAAECAELEGGIEELNTEQAKLRAFTQELKGSIKELKDRLSSLKYETLSATESAEEAERGIVPSPERLREEMTHLQEQLEEKRQEVQVAERQLRDVKARLEVAHRCEADVGTARKLMEEAAKEAGKLDEATSELRSAVAEEEAAKAAVEEAKTRTEHAEKQVRRHEERIKQFRPSAEAKSKASDRVLAVSKEELDQVQAETHEAKALAAEAQGRRDRVEKEREAEKRLHLAAMGEMDETVDRLTKQVKRYHQSLFAALAETKQGI